jgi:hypothetical protein
LIEPALAFTRGLGCRHKRSTFLTYCTHRRVGLSTLSPCWRSARRPPQRLLGSPR